MPQLIPGFGLSQEFLAEFRPGSVEELEPLFAQTRVGDPGGVCNDEVEQARVGVDFFHAEAHHAEEPEVDFVVGEHGGRTRDEGDGGRG